MPNERTVAVVGLGKLGAPMVASFASRGLRVIGVDLRPEAVDAVNSGRAPVFEPGLAELLSANRERISATTDIQAAVREAEATFIIVPTPSEPGGGFSLRHVLPVCEGIGAALRGDEDFHTIVLTATVMPGDTGGPVRDALERSSGRRCGESFGLCYSPEFIALGSVIHDFLNPDFVLIGESDPRAGEVLEGLYRVVCANRPPIQRMSWINAELTKLSLNTFVTTKISFANMIAGLCERLPGADADVVTGALGLDTRIGRRYLKGAIGYGGPCFPRDNKALAAVARRVGADAGLAEATDGFNSGQLNRLVGLVATHLPPGGTVGILGLTYKPETDVIEESQAVALAAALARQGNAVVVFDPAAGEPLREALGAGVRVADSAAACAEAADVLVLATPWAEFAQLDPELLARPAAPRVVIDCWRHLEREAVAAVARYVAVGVGPGEATSADDDGRDA